MKKTVFLLVFASSLFIFCKQEPPKAVASSQPQGPSKPAPLAHGSEPKARPALPPDAMCFVSKSDDGRQFEIRLAMVDKERVAGDLLISNSKTGAFAQGKLTGKCLDGKKFLLTWAFTDDENARSFSNFSYFLKDGKLIERSQDKDDDGRVFERVDCGNLK